MFKYFIEYTDNTNFTGESLNSNWNEQENKHIKTLLFAAATTVIRLTGYDAYNHIVERASFLSGKEQINKIYVFGKTKSYIEGIEIDVQKMKFRKITRYIGQEYMNNATTGWKNGIGGIGAIELLKT